MKLRLVVVSCAMWLCSCLTSVPEAQCVANSDCQAGQRCDARVCVSDDGGSSGGGSAAGGGSASGGGSAAGGGSSSAGGSASGGGIATGGGSGAIDGGVPSDGGVCGPGTCAGCCAFGFCIAPQVESRFTCGSNGAMCTTCPGAQQCVNGACATPVCTPASCPNGCCANGVCESGTSAANCGVKGTACVNCGQGNLCSAGGTCTGGGSDGGLVDGGLAGAIGDACSSGAGSCAAPGQCLPALSGFPDGYCTQACGLGSPCPGGSTCITTTIGPASAQSCMATCPVPGGQSTCRTGYVCEPLPSGGGTTGGFCRPNCNNGALASCPPNRTCQASGLCK